MKKNLSAARVIGLLITFQLVFMFTMMGSIPVSGSFQKDREKYDPESGKSQFFQLALLGTKSKVRECIVISFFGRTASFELIK